MKHIIEQDKRGLKFKQGSLKDVLGPGVYSSSNFLGTAIEIFDTAIEFRPNLDLKILLQNEKLASALHVIEVADDEVCLHYEDKNFKQVLIPGWHAFWKTKKVLEFKRYSIADTMLPDGMSPKILENPQLLECMVDCTVPSSHKGLLYYNREFQRELKPGKYYFWQSSIEILVPIFDLRQQQLDMTGQEVMTKDKVTLRLNFICHYRILDPKKLNDSIDDYKAQLYIVLQLILREYIGNLNLDELLEQKQQIGNYAMDQLQKRIPDWGLEFITAGVKDIILPGEIKSILEKVLEAEKIAQANIIMRREETASTRSLLNTAKLMEENPLLFRLKEMEHIEKISQKINSITLNGHDTMASQLARLLGTEKTGIE